MRPPLRTRQGDDRVEHRVWLTFDDGPHREHTRTILDTLKVHKVPATFFVVGQMVNWNGKDILKRARDEGHHIGNHSFTHPRLTELSEAEVREELSKTDEIIDEFHGDRKLFRPPYGAHDETAAKVIGELGYEQILWNVDTLDWSRANQPDRWVQLGMDRLRRQSRAVILMHDIWGTTAEHLNLFIRQIKELGSVRFEPTDTLWDPGDEGRRANQEGRG